MADIYEEVMNKAQELGELVTQTDEFTEVKQKQALMFHDNSAMELLQSYDDLKKQQKERQDNGEELTQEDTDALEQQETKLNENENIKNFFDSQKKFQEMINKALELIIRPSKQ
ncbi:MAG: YlbF family regulator [Clostridiales bacterium]|nr:YlbF family regulator [Clostridiales bacterium]MCF8021399.1 YlbF family regulator [Clostridiales bacterium]